MSYREFIVSTSGSNGSATGALVTEPLRGTIEGIRISYASMPGTTDVTIAETQKLQRTLLAVSNNNAAVTRTPVHEGVGASTDNYGFLYYLDNVPLSITVADADAGASAVIVGVVFNDT